MTWIEGLIVAIILAILGIVCVPTVINIRTQNACLAHGYPQSDIAVPSFTRYCIKRVNQTDSVVPLRALIK